MSFKLSFELIDHLRKFQLLHHDYSKEYLIKLNKLISGFLLKNTCFTSKFSPRILCLAVHFYFGAIYSFNCLFEKVGFKGKMARLSNSDINFTNIISINSLSDALKKFKSDDSVINDLTKEEYIEIPINFSFENGNSSIHIDRTLIEEGILLNGKIDIYIVSYICNILNKIHSIKLFPQMFAKSKCGNEKSVQNYATIALDTIDKSKSYKFDKEKFLEFRKKLVNLPWISESTSNIAKFSKRIDQFLIELEIELQEALNYSNEVNYKYLEKLLIGMFGHNSANIRNASLMYLNVLYDKVDWQLRGAFNPVISKVGDTFRIEYLVETDDENNLIILLNSPSFSSYSDSYSITWHRPHIQIYNSPNYNDIAQGMKKEKFFLVSIEFGPFQKCGFYDWKLCTILPNGKVKGASKIYTLKQWGKLGGEGNYNKLNELLGNPKVSKTKPIQGRYIVHPKNVKDIQFHEIYPNLLEDMLLKNDDDEKINPSYNELKESLPVFAEMGINCLYLLGVLERDVEKEKLLKETGQFVSPLSCTNRANLNQSLGSEEEFLEVITEAESNGIMIIAEALTKISSSRPNRKYWKYFLETLNEEGMKIRMYGADGKAVHFDDGAIMNYRKKKTWDLMVNDIVEFIMKYKVHGIHLDHCHNWPQLFKPNMCELLRKDYVNGEWISIYTEKEIFEGNVVIASENSGFWETKNDMNYANPFIIKICRELWSRFPQLLIIGEVWIGRENEVREGCISQSGPIPRVYVLPTAISRLLKGNDSENNFNANSLMFLGLLENLRKAVPRNAILIQSTCSHIWQYPHKMFKEGFQAAIDLFFLLPDIPGTFLGEHIQSSERPQILNIFKRVYKENSKKMSYSRESRNFFTDGNTEQKLLHDSANSSDFNHHELRSIPSGVTFSIFYLEKSSNPDKNIPFNELDILEFFIS